MFKKTLLCAAIVTCVISTSAQAIDFSTEKPALFDYNYIDGGYADWDNGFDGFGGRASYVIKPNLAVVGSYESASREVAGFDLDFSALSVGAAYFSEYSGYQNTDLVLHAEYVSYDLEVARFGESASVDESGFRFGAKFRHQLQPNLEVAVDASFETSDMNDFVITPEFAYSVQDNMSVVGSYALGDNDHMFIGGRLTF